MRIYIEVAYAAQLAGGVQELDPLEVLDAGWFPVTELPAGTLPAHRQLIGANAAWYAESANTAETKDDCAARRTSPARGPA
ncbi:MAG: hypothetical protein WCF33_05935 [Pseudonocardiaceae bacterium]